MGQYHEQIKSAILKKVYEMKRMHQRDIKAVIDEIKNQYLWNSKITLEELKKATDYFKVHWRELKAQARDMRRENSVIGFASYQL